MIIQIEQIRPELTWRLRQRVLYPAEKLYQMEMDEDNNGVHFGAFQNDDLVAVVSLFQKGKDFQFRKFAVDAEIQNKGVGRMLLNYMVNYAIAEGAEKIWCNARLSAIGFYLKLGFAQTGVLFSKQGFDYEIMERLIPEITPLNQ